MTVKELCENAKKASFVLAGADREKRREAVIAMADSLVKSQNGILSANALDIKTARENGVREAMIDRLSLDGKRIKDIADSLKKVADLPDPLDISETFTRPNGLVITKKRVPFGVIAIIYEARPNVTADAAALCVKTGNAVVLRGGKEAINSNLAIAEALSQALVSVGLPGDCVSVVSDTSRESANGLMRMNGLVDLLIPRGGKALIRSVVENATVPCIETGAGNCHVYFDADADAKMAIDIIDNAKRSRPSVCNAAESLLVCRSRAKELLPLVKERLGNVELRGDAETRAILPGIKEATEDDYYTEYNDYILSVKVVADVKEAVDHINVHGTKHSECIVTENASNAEYFLNNVDAAAVYVNASTRFTDGGEFGFGAEIGISTQKMHARGPMALYEMTTYKYIVRGNGQVR
ncbi:MAG: glutamate-5-semialdehyde dehydrogenase [Clostridia bacterium]|nr:glutamate-5-semialdehyde dehydrogenase [Clostridia bacterium]